MFFHGLIDHFFFVMNNIPLYDCATVYLTIHLLKDILIASMFWQLWIKLLWTLMGRFFVGVKTFFGKYQRAWSPDFMVRVCLLWRNSQTVFQSSCTILQSCQQWGAISCCFTSAPTFGVISVLYFGLSNKCTVVPHCCFNLHFPDDIWYGASFYLTPNFNFIIYMENICKFSGLNTKAPCG